MKNITLSCLAVVLSVLTACKSGEKESEQTLKLFTELPADSTGIIFSNTVVQDTAINLYNFEYLYNGGGVAVGDINNDGLADIYFTASVAKDKLYLNKGNFKFEDIS